MVKALQKRKAPPIANLVNIPEHFKELNFATLNSSSAYISGSSGGGRGEKAEYGLHLAAGFGSHFAFLFIGGAIPRKGVDILVNAYLNTFTRQDNVVLVIKGCEQYTDTMANKIKDLAKRTDIPEIIYFTEDIDPDMLPSLYRSCDLYVQPYRAEGFGLPIAEAMACGLPTIVTGEGSARDFTSEQTSLYIRSVKEYFVENRVSQFETANTPYWYVPDMNHLGQLMRVAYENQNAVKLMGALAAETIVKTHTWKHGAEVIAQRIRSLNS